MRFTWGTKHFICTSSEQCLTSDLVSSGVHVTHVCISFADACVTRITHCLYPLNLHGQSWIKTINGYNLCSATAKNKHNKICQRSICLLPSIQSCRTNLTIRSSADHLWNDSTPRSCPPVVNPINIAAFGKTQVTKAETAPKTQPAWAIQDFQGQRCECGPAGVLTWTQASVSRQT